MSVQLGLLIAVIKLFSPRRVFKFSNARLKKKVEPGQDVPYQSARTDKPCITQTATALPHMRVLNYYKSRSQHTQSVDRTVSSFVDSPAQHRENGAEPDSNEKSFPKA